MVEKYINIIVAVIFASIGLLVILLVPSQVAGETYAAIIKPSSPGFFPIVGGSILIVASLSLIVKMLTFKAPGSEQNMVMIPYPRFFFKMSLLIVLYVAAINIVGMIAASVVMIPFMARILRYENWKIIIAVAIIVPAFVFLLFEKVLLVMLPQGVLF